MEEGTEFLTRLKTQQNLPLFTSCCPGWVNWVELNRPDLLPNLSTTKSPQQMHGALTKRGAFVKTLGENFSKGLEEPYVVSIMPCTAKKDEARRPSVSEDIDHVLTTRELAHMIKARGIAFHALPQESEDGKFDNPLGESTGAAQIFGASGGVMEAVVRTAAHLLNQEDQLPLEWHALRGVQQGIKEATIPGVGSVAICNGIASAQNLLKTEAWRTNYVAIEVMTCVGGCLGGGGEPKSMDAQILQKRMQAIYQIDANAPRRRSYENADVQKLYATELEAPNSPKAHQLLHTHYAARHSKRLVLMQFLDAVDRRDSQALAELFSEDATWDTASPFGLIQGIAQIQNLVQHQLPPRKFGAHFARHKMANAADIADLTVITPAGEKCQFDIEIQQTHTTQAKISRLKRMIL